MEAGVQSLSLPDCVAAVREIGRRRTPAGTAYTMAGEGETLVLIHGVGMRLEAWAPQILHLAKTRKVIALDMPGHGESVALPVGSGLKDFVAWVGRTLEELGEARVSLAGHSMGALIAGGAAASLPDRIARVACLNGVFCREPQAKRAVMERAAAIWTEGVDILGPMRRWFGEDATGIAARDLVVRWLSAMDRRAYAITYTAFATGDETFAEAWPRVTAPALFLTADGDPNSTPEMTRHMASLAPRGRAVVIEGHRHMVNLTAPDRVNTELERWLSEPV